MSVSSRFVLEQAPTLKGMGGAAIGVLKERLGLKKKVTGPVTLPGPEFHRRYPPRDPTLIKAYVRHVGGDPGAYKRRVPMHLFPQWAFALIGPCLEGTSYPLLAGMNGGCRLKQNAPIPANEPLELSGRLTKVDDDGRRAILEIETVTSTRSAPNALIATMVVFVPLPKKKDAPRADKPKKEKPRVPATAKEIAFFKLGPDAGLDFAKLTGDFNPVHWVPAYAKAFGFRNTILHGFGTMARAVEGLNRGLFAGDVDAIESLDVRFTRPLVLPAKVGVYVEGEHVWVGTAPSGPAFLQGTFTTRTS